MPYAVTLPLDDAAATDVRRMWHALAEQAGADDAVRLGYVPHITLAVLPSTVPAAEIEEAAFRYYVAIATGEIGLVPGG